MKKITKLFSILASAVVLLSAASCKGNFNFDLDDSDVKDAKLIPLVTDNARTIFPDVEIAALDNFKLYKTSAVEENLLAEWQTFEAFKSGSVNLAAGTYTFVLTANDNGTTLEGSRTATLLKGVNTVSFELSIVDYGKGKGSVNLNVSYPNNNGVKNISSSLISLKDSKEYALDAKTISQNLETNSMTINLKAAEIPAGAYRVKLAAQLSGDYYFTYSDIVYVATGVESKGEYVCPELSKGKTFINLSKKSNKDGSYFECEKSLSDFINKDDFEDLVTGDVLNLSFNGLAIDSVKNLKIKIISNGKASKDKYVELTDKNDFQPLTAEKNSTFAFRQNLEVINHTVLKGSATDYTVQFLADCDENNESYYATLLTDYTVTQNSANRISTINVEYTNSVDASANKTEALYPGREISYKPEIDGYFFMKWLDEKDNEVSTVPDSDITLTASLVKMLGSDEGTSYTLNRNIWSTPNDYQVTLKLSDFIDTTENPLLLTGDKLKITVNGITESSFNNIIVSIVADSEFDNYWCQMTNDLVPYSGMGTKDTPFYVSSEVTVLRNCYAYSYDDIKLKIISNLITDDSQVKEYNIRAKIEVEVVSTQNRTSPVTMSFDPDGGNLNSMDEYTGKVIRTTATKEGYIFDGWYSDYTKVSKASASAGSLKARYVTKKNYKSNSTISLTELESCKDAYLVIQVIPIKSIGEYTWAAIGFTGGGDIKLYSQVPDKTDYLVYKVQDIFDMYEECTLSSKNYAIRFECFGNLLTTNAWVTYPDVNVKIHNNPDDYSEYTEEKLLADVPYTNLEAGEAPEGKAFVKWTRDAEGKNEFAGTVSEGMDLYGIYENEYTIQLHIPNENVKFIDKATGKSFTSLKTKVGEDFDSNLFYLDVNISRKKAGSSVYEVIGNFDIDINKYFITGYFIDPEYTQQLEFGPITDELFTALGKNTLDIYVKVVEVVKAIFIVAPYTIKNTKTGETYNSFGYGYEKGSNVFQDQGMLYYIYDGVNYSYKDDYLKNIDFNSLGSQANMVGFSLTKDPSDDEILNEYILNEDTTLYIVWEPAATFKLHLDGGYYSGDNTEYQDEDSVRLNATVYEYSSKDNAIKAQIKNSDGTINTYTLLNCSMFKKEHYVASGVYTDSTYETPFTSVTVKAGDVVDLYVKFEPAPYLVLHTNGGTFNDVNRILNKKTGKYEKVITKYYDGDNYYLERTGLIDASSSSLTLYDENDKVIKWFNTDYFVSEGQIYGGIYGTKEYNSLIPRTALSYGDSLDVYVKFVSYKTVTIQFAPGTKTTVSAYYNGDLKESEIEIQTVTATISIEEKMQFFGDRIGTNGFNSRFTFSKDNQTYSYRPYRFTLPAGKEIDYYYDTATCAHYEVGDSTSIDQSTTIIVVLKNIE